MNECGEKGTQKNKSEFQMGFEPVTFRILIGCSGWGWSFPSPSPSFAFHPDPHTLGRVF